MTRKNQFTIWSAVWGVAVPSFGALSLPTEILATYFTRGFKPRNMRFRMTQREIPGKPTKPSDVSGWTSPAESKPCEWAKT